MWWTLFVSRVVMSRGYGKPLPHKNTIAVKSLGFLEFGRRSRNLGGDGRGMEEGLVPMLRVGTSDETDRLPG
jgi:hypothetical protein